MKKIVIYAPNWYPFLGGIATHIEQIIVGIPEYSFDIITNAVAGQPVKEKFRNNTLIIRIGPDDLTLSHPGFEKLPKYYYPQIVFNHVRRIRRKMNVLKINRFQVLHVHGPVVEPSSFHLDTKFHTTFFSSLSNFSKIKCKKVITCHGLASHFNKSPEVKNIETRLLNQFDRIICVDEYVYEDAKKMIEDLGKITFIPNSVDTSVFSYKEMEKHSELTIGYIGRLSVEREFSLVEELIEKKPDYMKLLLVIAGSDKKVKEVMSKYKSPDIKVLPNVPPSELPKHIYDMDILLNPVSYEGSSRATLEAMSCGRPAIMLDIGNRYPIIDNENGFLIKNDVNELLKLLDELKNSKEKLQQMSVRARKIIENEYSNEVIIPKIKRIYDSV